MSARVRKRWMTIGAIVIVSIVFRLPPLLSARATNSDAAIVGLQAMHILRGEFSWLLFGSRYQTSCDSIIAAIFFLFTGASALSLMASTLFGHIASTLLAWDVLRKRTSDAWATALVLPLIFTGAPIHTFVLYPPRQASLTLAFLAVWLIDGASSSRKPIARFAAGSFIASIAVFADPYAILFLPAILVFALLACRDDAPASTVFRKRVVASIIGAILGAIPFALLSRDPNAAHGTMTLSSSLFAHNARLLWDVCLPWAMSYGVHVAPTYDAWNPPRVFAIVQIIAAIMIAILVACAILIALFDRTIDWKLRRIGVLGFLTVPLTLGGFLVSVMIMDVYSSRYLVAMLLFLPFALAPFARKVRLRLFAVAIAPYVVASMVAGWVAYGPSAHAVQSFDDEQHAIDFLAAKNITYATADYWASYRLTFASREKIIVVPKNKIEDRYAPYRIAFDKAPVAAYIFDRDRSREAFSSVDDEVRERGREIDRATFGAFTVIVFKRDRNAMDQK
jgi:hypothetical protein